MEKVIKQIINSFACNRFLVVFVFIKFLSVVLQFLGVFFITRYAGPILYGRFSLLLTVPIISNQIIFGPLANGIIRYLAQARSARERGGIIMGAVLALAFALILTLGVAFLGFLVFLISANGNASPVDFTSSVSKMAVLVALLILLSSFQLSASSVLLGMHRRLHYIWAGMVEYGVRLLAYLALFLAGSLSIYLLGLSVLISLLSSVFVCILLIFANKRLWYTTVITSISQYRNLEYIKLWSNKILSFSLIFVAWGSIAWIQAVADKWLLAIAGRNVDVGVYAFALNLSFAPFAIVIGAVAQFVLPAIYSQSKNDLGPGIIQYWLRTKSSLVFMALCLGGICINYSLVRLLIMVGIIEISYSQVLSLVVPMCIGAISFYLAEIIKEALVLSEQRQKLLIIKVGYVVVSVCLNAIACFYGTLPMVAWVNAIVNMLYLIVIFLDIYGSRLRPQPL